MRRFLALLFLASLTLAARAQSVHWEGSDDSSELQLVFDDCAPDGDVQLPPIQDSTLSLTGTSTQISTVNGSFSRSTVLTYNSRARRAGVTLHIPAFTVQTTKGPQPVAAFTGGTPRVIPDSTVSSRLMPNATQVWAGEVFSLTYVLDATRRSFSGLGSDLAWNPSPLVTEDWSKPEPVELTLNGEPRINIIQKTRGYAKVPGPVALNPATQIVRIATGNIGFGLFQQQRVEELTVSSRRPELTVRALPPAPPGFSGAVGEFKLVSKVVPTTAAVGDPVTWTLELSGTGNWPDIPGLPQREVSKDFQVVQPQAKRTPAEGKLFDATLSEDVVLVPTKPGPYTLGPVNFVYFDPHSGTYQTITTEPATINITPAATAPATVSLPSAHPTATPPAAAPAAPEVPAPPVSIPRDPLPATGPVPVPRPPSELATLLLAPFCLLLIFWVWLAVQRARRTDPARPRREARARLAATLARLPTAPEPERTALLLGWQHDTAALWQVAHAAPPATAFPDPAWAALWTESDRALYCAKPGLPSDWVPRAEAALVAKRVPGFSPFSALLLRNLLPCVAFLALALGLASLHAEDAGAAYRRGDFAAAEKAWTAAVAQDGADPSARYNLSLALAQQDHWDLAMAHATAAFVQDPASEPIRWQFALAGEKSGYLPFQLAAFPHPGPEQALAQLASPGEWQLWLLGASAAVALALGLLLYSAYHRASRLRTWGAGILLVAGVLVAASAGIGLHAYGETADARAVIVAHSTVLRSIPTEADTTQKTSPLAPGSIAIIDHAFLDWVRLSFENGQTGWVRKDDVVGLWK